MANINKRSTCLTRHRDYNSTGKRQDQQWVHFWCFFAGKFRFRSRNLSTNSGHPDQLHPQCRNPPDRKVESIRNHPAARIELNSSGMNLVYGPRFYSHCLYSLYNFLEDFYFKIVLFLCIFFQNLFFRFDRLWWWQAFFGSLSFSSVFFILWYWFAFIYFLFKFFFHRTILFIWVPFYLVL